MIKKILSYSHCKHPNWWVLGAVPARAAPGELCSSESPQRWSLLLSVFLPGCALRELNHHKTNLAKQTKKQINKIKQKGTPFCWLFPRISLYRLGAVLLVRGGEENLWPGTEGGWCLGIMPLAWPKLFWTHTLGSLWLLWQQNCGCWQPSTAEQPASSCHATGSCSRIPTEMNPMDHMENWAHSWVSDNPGL